MINFKNDYSDIAHPNILKKLVTHQSESYTGYGLDRETIKVVSHMKSMFKNDIDIHFLTGGTITNKTVISHILKPYEAVISAETGHIFVHETGAIEHTGHKIISVATKDGKLTPEMIQSVYQSHVDEHMVKPKLVYISNSTETGLIYSKQELMLLYDTSKSLDLWLYLDGARLGVALNAKTNDLTLDEISKYTDLFYIGGTKNGALFGEALIIKNNTLKPFFRYSIKQNGGLLAKGFLTALQFDALFEDNLFNEIAISANESSRYLIEGLHSLGLELHSTPTNQQFVTLPNEWIKALGNKYLFEVWTMGDKKSTIRLVTTYQTTKADIDSLIRDISLLMNKEGLA